MEPKYKSETRVQKRMEWLRDDVNKLFIIWPKYLNAIGKHKRNIHIYQQMSDEMQILGVNVSAEELRVKVNNVKQIWRREKKNCALSGQLSDWDLFPKVEKLLGTIKSCDATYVNESTSMEADDGEEPQSISSDFEVMKHEPVKTYDGPSCDKIQHDTNLETFLRQMESIGSYNSETDGTVKIEPNDATSSNSLANLQELDQKRSKESCSDPSSDVSSKLPNPINCKTCRPEIRNLKKLEMKRTSDKSHTKLLNKETIVKLKQEKLFLEIENLKKINSKVDLQIEKTRLENRLLSLKVRHYQKSFNRF